LKALLEEAGSEGLTHAEISERLTDVAANTLNTYLSVMANSGELERDGDIYRTGTPAADGSNDASDDEDAPAESDQEDSEKAEAAE
jgi:DNA-binding IclR family transcriptional regulator